MCSSPNIVQVIKARRMRWVGYAARMGRGVVQTRFWWGNPREGDYLEDPGVDARIIFGWIFRMLDVVIWTGSRWLRTGTDGGHL